MGTVLTVGHSPRSTQGGGWWELIDESTAQLYDSYGYIFHEYTDIDPNQYGSLLVTYKGDQPLVLDMNGYNGQNDNYYVLLHTQWTYSSSVSESWINENPVIMLYARMYNGEACHLTFYINHAYYVNGKTVSEKYQRYPDNVALRAKLDTTYTMLYLSVAGQLSGHTVTPEYPVNITRCIYGLPM